MNSDYKQAGEEPTREVRFSVVRDRLPFPTASTAHGVKLVTSFRLMPPATMAAICGTAEFGNYVEWHANRSPRYRYWCRERRRTKGCELDHCVAEISVAAAIPDRHSHLLNPRRTPVFRANLTRQLFRERVSMLLFCEDDPMTRLAPFAKDLLCCLNRRIPRLPGRAAARTTVPGRD